MANTEATTKYLKLFEERQDEIFATDPDFVKDIRKDALANFGKLGFPKKKQEEYKYLHLEPYFNGNLSNNITARNAEINVEEIFQCDIISLDTHVLLVLNGFFYAPNGDKLTKLDNGAIFGSLEEAKLQHPDLVKKHYATIADHKNDSFVALNTAFAKDGIFVYVPENQKLDKPIQIIHLLLSDDNEMVQHRNLFIAEKGSQSEIIVCDHTLSNHIFLTNSVTEVDVQENASMDIVRVQNEHNHSVQLTNTWVNQQAHSNVGNTTITLHGGKIRNNLEVKMQGEGAHCDARGLFLADKQQFVDSYTNIEHQKPHCTSNQHYKGVLDDVAKGAFSGKIHVFKDAQHTEAFQSNNNMLLTKDAKMHTKPQLEIYADDVKCSHGATVGQIDEEALFYLQARGIPKPEARMLMMYAFANDVISGLKEAALKDRIEDLVNKRLRGELSKCNSCAFACNE